MVTLFRSISNGIQWDEPADALGSVEGGFFWVQAFHFYIAFCSFAVLNDAGMHWQVVALAIAQFPCAWCSTGGYQCRCALLFVLGGFAQKKTNGKHLPYFEQSPPKTVRVTNSKA